MDVALLPGKGPLAPIEQENGQALESLWTRWRKIPSWYYKTCHPYFLQTTKFSQFSFEFEQFNNLTNIKTIGTIWRYQKGNLFCHMSYLISSLFSSESLRQIMEQYLETIHGLFLSSSSIFTVYNHINTSVHNLHSWYNVWITYELQTLSQYLSAHDTQPANQLRIY